MPSKHSKAAAREPQARIIPDSRDARRDFYIPLSSAKAMLARGELGKDVTNDAYAPIDDKSLQKAKSYIRK